MSQNGNNNEFKNNTIIENETTPNQKIIERMNNSTRDSIKNGLLKLQKKTKEWITLKNTNKENSPYDLLRKDFARLDNYSNKINSLKTQNLNRDENLKNLKNNLLAYYVTYDHALQLMTQYEIYLTPKNGNNKSELQNLENLINTTSEKYPNNTESFKDRFVKLNKLLLSNYEMFKISFEKQQDYYNQGFNNALKILTNYYIALIENFENEVQNFNSSAANILKKLLELVQTIEKNPTNLESIHTKYKNLFNESNLRNLKKLFNNLSKKSENNLIKNKRNIISIKNLLNKPLKIGQTTVKLNNILENNNKLKPLPNKIPINNVNSNITTVLSYYNKKLEERITNINALLDHYRALCEQLKASIKIAKESKIASSDLKQIKRIENQVKAIMEQYTQLKNIGTNCKNLGNNIRNLSGKTNQGNTATMQGPVRFGNFPTENAESAPIITEQSTNPSISNIPDPQATIPINLNNVWLKDRNGTKKINMETVKFKANFIYNYLLNRSDRLRDLHLFEPAKRDQFNTKKALITNNGKVTDVDKLDNLIDKIEKIQRQRVKTSKTSALPINKIGYERFLDKKLNINERIEYAFINKDWLVAYLKNARNAK